MPDWFAVVLLGIIEGITEFLPVSSTGHLLLSEHVFQSTNWLPGGHWLVQASAEKDLFNVVIQCGAVLAVLPLFPGRLRQFFFRWREKGTQDYLLKILAAFAITGVAGFVLEKKTLQAPRATAARGRCAVRGRRFVCAGRTLAERTAVASGDYVDRGRCCRHRSNHRRDRKS